MADVWDPTVYQARRDERGRPFGELVARIAADPAKVRTVVDLGCGPGNLTAELPARFGQAQVHGLDSSAKMIAEAQRRAGPRLSFAVGDVSTWMPAPDTDVVVTNAVLHWVDGHPELLRRWAEALRPGAWLAVQVPGNQKAPSHRAIGEVMATGRWRERLAGVADGGGPVLDSAGYAGILTAAGCHVDAWETTYLHELPADGETHPVVGWLEGTSLRPVINALDDVEWAQFKADLTERIAAAYPIVGNRAWFGFRRIFAVAERR